jgi:hypothetical protein
VPDVVILEGVIAPHVRPEGTVSVSETVPVNPLAGVTVMVEVADVPTVTAAGEVAVIEKLGAAPTVNVAVAVWVSVPLVPVIVTVYVAAVLDEQVRVAVPDPVMLVGVIAPHVRPDWTVSVRLTVPVKPLTAVTVIVDTRLLVAAPEGEVAAIVKSVIVNVAVAVWVSVPLVPVTVAVSVWAVGELHVSVEVPEPVTLVGLRVHVRPPVVETVSETVPVKPLTAVNVTVEVAETPGVTAAGDVAVIVKSVTVNVAVAVWTSEPLVPVIVSE